MYLHKTPTIIKKIYPQLVWSEKPNNNTIYLTFDDGPVPGQTEFVLEELETNNAKATFFCVGENVKKHPGIFSRIIAGNNTVGNHTFNHLNGIKSSFARYLENVELCQNEFSKQGYNRIVKLFRPPYGLITRSLIKELIWKYRIIMWDVLSGDFDQSLNPRKCLAKVIKSTKRGSIIVFHDSKKSDKCLKYVLPRFLEHCREKDFQFGVL